jgi:hypothetical protein
VTLQERRADTGLCHGCNKAAVDYFDVMPEQAGTTVLCKKIAEHFSTGAEQWENHPMRYRVRCLVLASTGSIPNATAAEQADATILREKFKYMFRNSPAIKTESQTDFLEGMP